MPSRPSGPARPPLRERKRQQSRERIVAAAYELFAEHGFTRVTVSEIADRADVGRTTFFRYFGDKQEVLFADEEGTLEGLSSQLRDAPANRAGGLAEAVDQVRPLVVAICVSSVREPGRWALHEQLVREHGELSDRHARKLARYAVVVEELLIGRGAPESTAALAAQLALACYHAGHRLAGGDAAALVPAVESAFDELASAVGGPSAALPRLRG